MRTWAPSRLVFIDESGVNLSLTRAEGRAPRGERVVDDVPGSRWENFSVIAALRSTGIVAPMILPGAMNGEALRTWVAQCLAPELCPGDIVIWDNLGIHGDAEVVKTIKACGARLRFLPPYSPDLNPIERAWSKMKSILRAIGARVKDSLVQGLADALGAITPRDCDGWFRHSGYIAIDPSH